MKAWVARSLNGWADWRVRIIKNKQPKLHQIKGYSKEWTSNNCYLELSVFDFKYLFGFTPRKGTCEKVELIIKRIDK